MPRDRFIGEAQRSEAYADRAAADRLRADDQSAGNGRDHERSAEADRQGDSSRNRHRKWLPDGDLAELAARVISIELHAALSTQAGSVLAELGYRNVELVIGDGTLGWARGSAVRGAFWLRRRRLPARRRLIEQLADGGDAGDSGRTERRAAIAENRASR